MAAPLSYARKKAEEFPRADSDSFSADDVEELVWRVIDDTTRDLIGVVRAAVQDGRDPVARMCELRDLLKKETGASSKKTDLDVALDLLREAPNECEELSPLRGMCGRCWTCRISSFLAPRKKL